MTHQHHESRDPRAVALIAGWGRYPILVAEALHRQGRRVVCLGIKHHVDPAIRKFCDSYYEFGLCKLGAAFRCLRRERVGLATMAGKVHKVVLFQPFVVLRHLPDLRCFRTFGPYYFGFTKDRKDDTLLGVAVRAFADEGVTIVPATDFVPELLVKTGLLTRRRPTSQEAKDIAFGWQIAKELGRLDVGQCVAVKGRAVLAIEAIEGTDQCIRRAGALCTQGGFTVVKVAKPQQDMRFDVPTIGKGTLESLVAAGARVLAVEAGKTILIDEPEVIDFANRHHLAIVALEADANGQLVEAA